MTAGAAAGGEAGAEAGGVAGGSAGWSAGGSAGMTGAGEGRVGAVDDMGRIGAGLAGGGGVPSVMRNPSLILSNTTLGGVGWMVLDILFSR